MQEMLLAIDLFATIVVTIVIIVLLLDARGRFLRRRDKLPSPPKPQSAEETHAPSGLPSWQEPTLCAPRFQQWKQSDFEWVDGPMEMTEAAALDISLQRIVLSSPIDGSQSDVSVKMEEKKYADPIDGMPFETGEPAVTCSCGLAYREESILWLHEYYAGQCTRCGFVIPLPADLQ